MKILSRSVLCLTLFSFAAQPVMADSLTSHDLNFAFGGGTAVSKTINQHTSSLTKAKRPSQQLASLQPLLAKEMKETEGAWLNFAIGGAIGLGSYLYTTPRSSWSWGGAARNTAYVLVGGGAFKAARYVARPWVRVGSSYSRSGGFRTYSIRTGSNRYYQNNSYLRHSSTLRSWNSRARNDSFVSRSWRTRDRGHYHLWRR